MTDSTQPDHAIDLNGLICPQPIINLKKELSRITKGKTLQVSVTDPSFEVDLQVLLRKTPHLLLQSWKEDNVIYYILEVR